MATESVLLFIILNLMPLTFSVKYVPTWKSLDARPLPAWYDEAKLGIFINFGVYSVPSFKTEWFWYYWKEKPWPAIVEFMQKNYRPGFEYADFAPMFTTEFFVPNEWAEIFQASRAKYIVMSSKHHEGFTLWPSKYSFNWNSNASGPGRDLVGELANSIKAKTNIKFGLYHSMFEWFNPLYLQDKQNNFTTQDFVKFKTLPELYEIVNNYKPEVVWSDGAYGPDTYWNSTEFLAWLYNERVLRDTLFCKFRNKRGQVIKAAHPPLERGLRVSSSIEVGKLQKHKFENAMTIDKSSWGYRRDAKLQDYMTIEEIIQTFIETVSCGGNMLMNVGPTKDGKITPIYEERLRQLCQWLRVNGEAIYESKPWIYQNDSFTKGVWYTSKDNGYTVYATLLQWPERYLILGSAIATDSTVITLLGYHQYKFNFRAASQGGINITIPDIPFSKMPSKWAWVMKLTFVKSNDNNTDSKYLKIKHRNVNGGLEDFNEAN